MGGSSGKIISPIARGLGDIATFGGNELFGNPIGNSTSSLLGGGGGPGTGSIYGKFFGSGPSNPYVSGPFSLDPFQYSKDKADITDLGNKQYSDTLSAIDTNSAAQTQRAKDLFAQTLPDIAENAQAAHLYDSTGYGNEVARQQGQIASQVASDAANAKYQALQGRQGFETGALQRGQSLEDFINQANVSKTLGAAFTPQAPTGKQQFGTVAQGVGALAPFAKLGKAAAV